MTTVILACLAFWLALITLWFLAAHSWSAAYTGSLAIALFVEVQARA